MDSHKEFFNISAAPVKTFLDTVDIVLNSNTFLLKFYIHSNNVSESLFSFLKSESFIDQLAQQDKDRDWYLFHDFDNDTDRYKLKQGNILKDKINLQVINSEFNGREYLIAMLTGDMSKGLFYSYYSSQVEREIAETIVDDMLLYLIKGNQWELSIYQPDFLKDSTNDNIRYFEGSGGNNNASVIKYKKTGFLLLTNGAD